MEYVLIVHFNIGDEDGPSLTYQLMPAADYKFNTPNNILVINLESFLKIINNKIDRLGAFLDEKSILQILKNYYIVRIVEIYDWYDFLNDNEVIDQQEQINRASMKLPTKVDPNLPYLLLTIIPYNVIPKKYLIPINSNIYEYVMNAYKILESDGEESVAQKEMFSNNIQPYEIKATYQEIIPNLTIVSDLTVISDEIDNPIFT